MLINELIYVMDETSDTIDGGIYWEVETSIKEVFSAIKEDNFNFSL